MRRIVTGQEEDVLERKACYRLPGQQIQQHIFRDVRVSCNLCVTCINLPICKRKFKDHPLEMQ